jgi:hypothetical protein
MQQIPKVTWSGGLPAEDLITVSPGQIKVHLYTCNRSQLHALCQAAKQVLQAMPLADAQPDVPTVTALLATCAERAAELSGGQPPAPQPEPNRD